MASKEEDTNDSYEYWEPTAAYLHLQKYKLIIFEWNALFHHITGKALPGVADCLFLLNNFLIKGNRCTSSCWAFAKQDSWRGGVGGSLGPLVANAKLAL